MEGEIVIKRWEDLDGEVSSYRLCCLLRLTSTLIRLLQDNQEDQDSVIRLIDPPWTYPPSLGLDYMDGGHGVY